MAELNENKVASINRRIKTIADDLAAVKDQMAILLRPPIYRRAWTYITEHKGQSAVFVALLAVCGCVGSPLLSHWLDHRNDEANAALDTRINNILNKPEGVTAKLDRVNDSVIALNTTISNIQPYIQQLVIHNFQSFAQLPVKEIGDRLEDVKQVFAVAKDNKIPLDRTVLTNTGKRLVYAAEDDGNVWQAALQFASYKTFTNRLPAVPFPEEKYNKPVGGFFQDQGEEKLPVPVMYSGGLAKKEDGARIDPIGQDNNPNNQMMPGFIRLEGNSFKLDNLVIRNVFFNNVTVYYHGGPIQMSNVFFLNCTFIVDHPTERAKGFIDAAISTYPLEFNGL